MVGLWSPIAEYFYTENVGGVGWRGEQRGRYRRHFGDKTERRDMALDHADLH